MTIKATSIQASRANGVTIHTLLCEFPISILNQLLNHRAFSTSTSSCRAVPIKSAIDQMTANPAQPIWTAKGKGMVGEVITDPATLKAANVLHKQFTGTAIAQALAMDELGIHKQNAGRYLTPHQNCKVLLTSTDWANWDWLRDDNEAQPEIQEAAKAMKIARDNAEVMDLEYGEYHVPGIARHRAINGDMEYFIEDDEGYEKVGLKHAIMVSMSINAQTSYRKGDGSLEKAEKIQEVLFNGRKVHASPSEHIATPMQPAMVRSVANPRLDIPFNEIIMNLPEGVTSINTDGTLSSGNFNSWIQHRQTLPNHDHGIGEHSPQNLAEMVEVLTGSLDDLIKSAKKERKEEFPNRPTSLEEFSALSIEQQCAELDLLISEVTEENPELTELLTSLRKLVD